jgi:hypothetical protein
MAEPKEVPSTANWQEDDFVDALAHLEKLQTLVSFWTLEWIQGLTRYHKAHARPSNPS